MKYLNDAVRERIANGEDIDERHDPFLTGYITEGGTYMLASNNRQTESGLIEDVAAIGIHGQVFPTKLNTNPDLIEELQQFVDEVRAARTAQR